MLTIRLSRIGKRKKPAYRLIILEKAKDPYGRVREILGSYNPLTKDLRAKNDRIQYWLSQGAGMSPTVNNLLIEKAVIKGEKVKASMARKKKKKEAEKEGEKPAETVSLEQKKEEKADDKEKAAKKTEEQKKETNQEPEEEKIEKSDTEEKK